VKLVTVRRQKTPLLQPTNDQTASVKPEHRAPASALSSFARSSFACLLQQRAGLKVLRRFITELATAQPIVNACKALILNRETVFWGVLAGTSL
jgi:hypothetical protein